MTKLSNAKKSVQTVEINTVDVAADTVAATLITRIALDASDKPVTRIALDASDKPVLRSIDSAPNQTFSEETATGDMMGEGAPDFDRETEEAASDNVQLDPMAQYGDLPVKMAYVFDGMELPMNVIIKANDASVEAAKRANDPSGPKVAVAIRCATTDAVLFTVEPTKGARKVSIIPGTRQTSTRTVTNAGMSEEEKARIEAEKQRKEEERAAKAWDAMVDAAEKDNAKFDAKREKEIKEMAIKFAKAMEKMRRHPKEDTEAYQNYLLFIAEEGATCKELNNAHNVRNGTTTANFGWKQIALDMEKKYLLRLIATGRQCKVSDKKGLSEAMRLIDRDIEIPAGWVDISRF